MSKFYRTAIKLFAMAGCMETDIDNNLHRLFLSFRKKIKDFYIRIQKKIGSINFLLAEFCITLLLGILTKHAISSSGLPGA